LPLGPAPGLVIGLTVIRELCVFRRYVWALSASWRFRVTLENQIRGLAVVFGIRLPRALTAAFIDQALKASEGIADLSAAMRGLIAARTAAMAAVAAIDADMGRTARASAACRRLMTIPGVGQLTALAFMAAAEGSRLPLSMSSTLLVYATGCVGEHVAAHGGPLRREQRSLPSGTPPRLTVFPRASPPLYALGRNRARFRREVMTASTAKPACRTAKIQPTT
jgi:hypothetical protein